MSKGPVLIIGGSSDIGLAVARRFAQDGHPIQLAARRPDELAPEQQDIALRYGVEVSLHPFDALDCQSHEAFVAGLPDLPEIAVCAVGLLGDQSQDERDWKAAWLVMSSNYVGLANILGILANRFAARGSGTIVGISSVAGERGRASNYIYGSAKAGFTAFLSGLRNRLASKGVHVLTVLPGFVDTKMTKDLQLPGALTASSADVADAIAQGVSRRRNVIYVRSVWMLIMAVIRNIPEFVFKRLSI